MNNTPPPFHFHFHTFYLTPTPISLLILFTLFLLLFVKHFVLLFLIFNLFYHLVSSAVSYFFSLLLFVFCFWFWISHELYVCQSSSSILISVFVKDYYNISRLAFQIIRLQIPHGFTFTRAQRFIFLCTPS
jgi:hypothetical protein